MQVSSRRSFSADQSVSETILTVVSSLYQLENEIPIPTGRGTIATSIETLHSSLAKVTIIDESGFIGNLNQIKWQINPIKMAK